MIHQLAALCARRALPISRVCSKLGVSIRELRALAEQAAAHGYDVRIRGGHVSSAVAVAAARRVKVGSTKPGRYRVLHWSDTHFGSRHADERAMVRTLCRAAAAGCRVAVHTGDLLDGNRPCLLADQWCPGLDEQAERLLGVLASSPKMSYITIDGNHDGYISSSAGLACGRVVQERARAAGIDWTFAGVCEGRARVHGADWFLWHPMGGSGTRMGVMRVMQEKVDALEEHADVLAMGHLHKRVSFRSEPQGVLCVAPGTFQRKGSEFSNRLSSQWDVGAVIVSYDWDGRRASSFAVDPA